MKGTFSHIFYDDLTDSIFLYFNEPLVINLTGTRDTVYKEVAVQLSSDQYEKMKAHFQSHPTKESCQ